MKVTVKNRCANYNDAYVLEIECVQVLCKDGESEYLTPDWYFNENYDLQREGDELTHVFMASSDSDYSLTFLTKSGGS